MKWPRYCGLSIQEIIICYPNYMSGLKEGGWVRLWRKIEEHDIWFAEPFTKAQAWIDIFLNANHKQSSIFIRGNEVVIKRGQLGWSELTMAKRWKWSKNKVRRFLKWLETEQQIEQQKDSLTTVLTIKNYDSYQPETIQQTKQQTIQQKDSRRYTNNNDKNEKNEKKDIYIAEQFLEFWNTTFNTKYSSADALVGNLTYWLSQYTLEQIQQAARNINAHDYWKDRMTPTILLRRKNPRGEAVDYIGELLNSKAVIQVRPRLVDSI